MNAQTNTNETNELTLLHELKQTLAMFSENEKKASEITHGRKFDIIEILRLIQASASVLLEENMRVKRENKRLRKEEEAKRQTDLFLTGKSA